ncbi:hypothetical protein SLA2020_269520 [Shorea laevis]
MPSDRSPLSWIDRSLGSIAEPWIDRYRSFQNVKRSLTADHDEMIFWIKDCGLAGYCGRRNHFSEDS